MSRICPVWSPCYWPCQSFWEENRSLTYSLKCDCSFSRAFLHQKSYRVDMLVLLHAFPIDLDTISIKTSMLLFLKMSILIFLYRFNKPGARWLLHLLMFTSCLPSKTGCHHVALSPLEVRGLITRQAGLDNNKLSSFSLLNKLKNKPTPKEQQFHPVFLFYIWRT